MKSSDETRPSFTKKQLAVLCTLSIRTFQRRLDATNLKIPRGLISYEKAKEILRKLGYGEKDGGE